MQKVKHEAAYFAMRTDESLRMAQAATSSCARLVHEKLANLYRGKVAALALRPPATITAELEIARTAGSIASSFVCSGVKRDGHPLAAMRADGRRCAHVLTRLVGQEC